MKDLPRLQALLGVPELKWLLMRLRARLERGESLKGTVALANATAQQRAAVDRLLGRTASRGASLNLQLDKLEEILRHADLCDSLTEAVEALTGPVQDIRAKRAHEKQQWAGLFRDAQLRVGECASLRAWIEDIGVTGLLLRLSGRDLRLASGLLEHAIGIVVRLPARGLALAELAAQATGDSHALDFGQPLCTLVLRAVTILGGIEDLADAQSRRDAWASVGVLCDELSAPVLVLNLRADAESLTGRALAVHAAFGEPYRLSVRQLLRSPPWWGSGAPGKTVFICENPTIVAAVADRLAKDSSPLVCVDGQPKTAARVLLTQLAKAGYRLAYHGDYDWKGIGIANLIMARHGAVPWRFSSEDYLGTHGGTRLRGSPVAAAWDAELQGSMMREQRAVHEEQVLETLIADLANPQEGGS